MRQLTISAKVKTHAKSRGVEVDKRGVYQVRTPTAPDRGQANRDVIAILSEHFRTPKSCITIVGGQTTNRKTIKVTVA